MKKYITILLCLLICLSLFGCSAGDDENINSITNADGQVAVAVTNENGELVTMENGEYATELAIAVTDENGELVTNEQGQYIVEKENGKQIAVGEPVATTASGKQTENNNTQGTTQDKSTSEKTDSTSSSDAKKTTEATKKTQTTTTTKPTTTKATTTKTSYITCTVTIVSGDNKILDSYSVNVESTDNASKIVTKACNENNIAIVTEQSALGGVTVKKIADIEGKWYYTIGNDSKHTYNFRSTVKNGSDITVSL